MATSNYNRGHLAAGPGLETGVTGLSAQPNTQAFPQMDIPDDLPTSETPREGGPSAPYQQGLVYSTLACRTTEALEAPVSQRAKNSS
jgi:hypothetical protein